jgi:hypothetical protein
MDGYGRFPFEERGFFLKWTAIKKDGSAGTADFGGENG